METVSEFKVHKLKCWPDFYEAVKRGDKTVELRKNDRNYRVGDVLVLQEWDPLDATYQGAEFEVLVTHITEARDFLKEGILALSIRRVERFTVQCADCGQGFRTYDNAHTHCSNCLYGYL